ncbi:ribulose 1,5-bisphosphate carboxylase [Candidatus Shapirobacteria bacterium]|nr:MAG: ribulose 1,5-bisphosphate carboxylase [Candidatus Shapirobacteria bacterium]
MSAEEFTYDPYAFSIFEGVDVDNHIIAIYSLEVEPGRDFLKIAEGLASEATTGTWIKVPTETSEIRKKYQAKVLGTYEIPSEGYQRVMIAVAHPIENFGPSMPMSMVLAGIAGNLFSVTAARVKLTDVFLPKNLVKEFKGPKFGIPGLRNMLNIHDRPLVGAILKPKTGMSPKEVAEVCYKAALGGADLIKDDEMQSDPSYCPRIERLHAVMEALDKAQEETGKKCLYALNITDRSDKMLEIAEKAVEEGANCLLINYITSGYENLRMVAEDPSVSVPLLAHPTMARALVRPENMGITYHTVKKLVRLCGADITILSSAYGKMYQPIREYFWSVHALRDPLYGIKSTLPALSGGVYPGLATQHVKDVGIDIMMIAGGGVLGHPMGVTAGVKAMVAAVEAAAKGIPLVEAAKTSQELKVAIDTWGVYEKPKEYIFKPK